MSERKTAKHIFTWAGFLCGVRLALPITMGYLPVSFAFGVLAANVGMSSLASALMAIFVYAGSGQLIAVDLMASGVGVASIILTTFVVNSRHLLMSAAVSPFLNTWSRPAQALFCAQMTDETFAVNMARFASHGVDKGVVFGITMTAHSSWITGCTLGAALGDAIGDVKYLGLDYALAGMFIALLLPHFYIPRRCMAALIAGGLSVLLSLQGLADWGVIIATASAATIVVLLQKKQSMPFAIPQAPADGTQEKP